MPIYEYRCSNCESHFEKMQKISEKPLKVCEKCGGELEKQWSLSGFQFKGAGWYVTDYANKGKAEAKSEGKSPAEGAAGAAVTETKSETTSSSEKSSTTESTARTESASNTTTSDTAKSDASASKKE